jgi:hypothetical protein
MGTGGLYALAPHYHPDSQLIRGYFIFEEDVTLFFFTFSFVVKIQ